MSQMNAPSQPQALLKALYTQAIDALNHGQWARAAQLSAQLLPMAPAHAGVQFVAGVAALGIDNVPGAIAHLRDAVRLNPDRADYQAQLARACATAGALGEAVEAARRGLALPHADALSLDTLGVVFTRCNAHALAATAFGRAVQLLPKRAGYRYNLATSLMFAGDMPAAEREYEACLALEPRLWRAHLALSQLREQRPDDNHLARLRALLEQYAELAEASLYLNLAIAKELEDLGQHQQALQHLVAGKQQVARRRRYDVARDAGLFEALAKRFDDVVPSQGAMSDEPIFVVGMPRSGTTLVDRILSSHPWVHSAGELMNFPMAVHRLSGAGGSTLLSSEVVAASARMDWKQLGEMYLQSTRPGTGHTAHFVDKLPHNFQYVGHILHALPRAKVILVQRDAMDTCVGNFRQLFAMESPFYDYSFDLLDAGRYYIAFERLMGHWMRLFPGRIFTLRYEALVAQQEHASRALLDYCGLPWDDACLRFHENAAPTATASVVQVREPLHGRFQQRWRRYGDAMEPLRQLLEQAGIAVPEAINA